MIPRQQSEYFPLPEPYRAVIVVCKRFSCPGFRDSIGIWRRLIDKKPLNDVEGWQEITREPGSGPPHPHSGN